MVVKSKVKVEFQKKKNRYTHLGNTEVERERKQMESKRTDKASLWDIEYSIPKQLKAVYNLVIQMCKKNAFGWFT